MGWGAFGGAAANAALSTYERLGEEELRDMQRKKMQKEIADEAALDAAWRNSQARVGQQDEYGQAIKTGGAIGTEQAKMLSDQGALSGNTPEDIAFEKASAEAAAGALRENAVRQGAISQDKAALPEMKPTEYTAKQGMADYVRAAGQVSRKGTLEAIQLKNVMRESDLQDKFDAEKQKLDDTLARIHGIAETGGLKGLADAANKEGLKVKFVEGKNGVGSRIQVLGPKGDVIETVSDINTATQKLSQAAMQQFTTKAASLLGSPDKVLAYMQGEKKIAIQEKEAADKGKYYEAYAGYLNAGAKGGTKETVKGKAAEYADALIEGKVINPKTNKPYTPEEAKVQAYDVILKNPNVKERSDWDYSSDKSVRSNKEGVVQDWNGKAWTTRGVPQVSSAAASRGVVADVDKSGRSAFKGADGWYSTEQEAYNSFSKQPTAATAAASQAIPTGRSDAEFNVMISNAKRNNPQARQYLQDLLDSNELTLPQKREALTALGR